MKITKNKLVTLIERLLFEEPDDNLDIDMSGYHKDIEGKEIKQEFNSLQNTIDKIIKSKAIDEGIEKAYFYINSDQYYPDKLVKKLGKEEFLNFKERLKEVFYKFYKEGKDRIKFIESVDAPENAEAVLIQIKENPPEFEMHFVVDTIKETTKNMSDNKFKESLINTVFHETMHIENYYFNQYINLSSDASDIMIDIKDLDDSFYSNRCTNLEKSGLKNVLEGYLNPKAEAGVDEIRVRISQFKANNNLRQAMQDASTKDFKEIKNKYGSSDAQWLFLLNYKKYNLDELEGKMNIMAKLYIKDVQNFKG